MSLTLFQKGLILLALPLLLQFGFLGLVVQMQRTNAQAQGWSAHSKEVIAQAHALLGGLVDAETGVRGYCLTGDPVFTEPFTRTQRLLPECLGRLQELLQDNPDQEGRLRLVAGKADAALSWLTETEQRVRAGSLDQAVARERTRAGKERMDELRRQVAGFLEVETQLDQQRARVLEQSQQQLNRLFVAGGAVSFLGTVRRQI